MGVLHMSKEEVDNADSEFLFNVIPVGMKIFQYLMSSLAGNTNPGIGTGYSKSSAKK